jgi:hypothetical protein
MVTVYWLRELMVGKEMNHIDALAKLNTNGPINKPPNMLVT